MRKEKETNNISTQKAQSLLTLFQEQYLKKTYLRQRNDKLCRRPRKGKNRNQTK